MRNFMTFVLALSGLSSVANAEVIRLQCRNEIGNAQLSVEIISNFVVDTKNKSVSNVRDMTFSRQLPGINGLSCEKKISYQDEKVGSPVFKDNCGPLFLNEDPGRQSVEISEDAIKFGVLPNLATVDRNSGQIRINGTLGQCEAVSNEKKF